MPITLFMHQQSARYKFTLLIIKVGLKMISCNLKQMSSKHKGQAGFTLVETSITVIIILVIFVQIINFAIFIFRMQSAQDAGVKIAQYNSAVASFINDLDPNVPTGTYTSIGWLQGPTCADGTGQKTYLTCGFDPYLPFNYSFNTTITSSTTANGIFYNAVTVLGPAFDGSGINRPVGGQTVAAARAFLGIPAQNPEKAVGYLLYSMNTDTGVVTATVDTSVSSVPWLNKDGTNQMVGNLNMGNNNINNANNVNAANANLTNNVTANNNITATNTVSGATVNATNSMTAGTTVSAGTDLNAGRNVQANAAGNGGDVSLLNTQSGGYAGVQAGPISLAAAASKPTFISISNPYVPKPNCPTGMIPHIYALEQNITVNGYAIPLGSIRIKAVDGDNSSDASIVTYPNMWTVVMSVVDMSHQDENGVDWNQIVKYATAMVTTNCT